MTKQNNKYRSKFIVGFVFILPALFYLVLNFGNHRYDRLSYYNQNQTTTNLKEAYSLDDFSLLDTDSKGFNKDILNGKIVLWNAIHTNDYLLTPAIIANLQFIQDRFKDRTDIQIISLVTNNSNKIQVSDYSKTLNINQHNWQIIQGDSTNIHRFFEQKLFINFKELPDSLAQVVTSNEIILMDKNRHVRGYFDGGIHKEVKGKLVDAIDMLAREEFIVYRDKE